ncbi:MAG TPA: selenide, water dikinase SelD [Roseomonas sp.]|nr:selenide, water dikinase SelD [Roseomonas sp.]
MADVEPPLTSLAHGGGCGCKLAPSVLQSLLAETPAARAFPDLLVGTETGDDAAVYRLNETQALVATTDFFTPVVDDPHDFGRIAATNALSDVYAMGGTPILALAILGMPLGKLAPEVVRRILAGGAEVCAEAGIPVAGGHSIDSPEPIYGLVALGLVRPDRLLRNSGARAGDRLILTKGLGIGIFSAALKRGALSPELYRVMLGSTTQLNRVGATLPDLPGVHAVTDVTGFGLLGHALEMCRGSGLGAQLRLDALPLLEGAEDLARAGFSTGAATRNWASYGDAVRLPPELPAWRRGLLCDPQTSGGLLIAVAPETAPELLAQLREAHHPMAAEIGVMQAEQPLVTVA